VYTCILLEKKILFLSRHKALLTQVINAFVSFMFPFQWKHTLIPVLPINRTDILDAPMPYIIGVEPNPNLEHIDLDTDVIRIDLDNGDLIQPEDMLMGS
jgi:hypothetical protein